MERKLTFLSAFLCSFRLYRFRHNISRFLLFLCSLSLFLPFSLSICISFFRCLSLFFSSFFTPPFRLLCFLSTFFSFVPFSTLFRFFFSLLYLRFLFSILPKRILLQPLLLISSLSLILTAYSVAIVLLYALLLIYRRKL